MAGAKVELSDEVLALASILGDLEAFGRLAERYRAAAVRTAQAIVGREDAEDVAQDALLLAFKALPSLEEPAKFAPWLGAIVRHRARRHGRREQARANVRVPLDEALLEHVGALSRPLVEERELSADVEAALERMPADYALVVRLRFLDDMPYARIASFVGVPVSTVKWRLHRGKRLLRQELTLSAGAKS